MFDKKKRCDLKSCDSNVLDRNLVAVLAYGCATLVLAIPFLNATGASVQNSANLSDMSISWTAIGIGVLWLISGLVTIHERHENAVACVIHACGIPGSIIAVLTAIQAQ